MNTVAIIQARMGSSRLPGKVLMDLGGGTVLARVVRRLQRCRQISQIVVATTGEAERRSWRMRTSADFVFSGSEQDVLDRYYRAARANAAETVVRVTSDCPLIDPELVDETIRVFKDEHADYASNVFPRTYPRGLDTEVFTVAALDRAWREAREPHQREHVTPYLYEHPQIFRLASLSGDVDHSHYRWTLDTQEDLELLRAIYPLRLPTISLGRRSWPDGARAQTGRAQFAVLQKSVREH